jgi:hypothetical protein
MTRGNFFPLHQTSQLSGSRQENDTFFGTIMNVDFVGGQCCGSGIFYPDPKIFSFRILKKEMYQLNLPFFLAIHVFLEQVLVVLIDFRTI